MRTSPLTSIASFGASRAAAAVVGTDGLIDSAGDITSPFALASVTKILVAYATLIAIEEGSVALADAAGPPGSTLAHLLAHASGISPNEVALVLAEPGVRRIYSTAAFGVIAGHLEAATGFPIADYLHQAVFDPLGMHAAALGGHPGSGAQASVEDLVAFASELLVPRLLSRASLDLATSVAFPGLDGVLPGFGRQHPCDYGLGFEIRDHKSPHWTGSANSPRTFGHFGQTGTMLWVDPEANIALIALCDRNFGDWAREAWPPLADAVLATYGAHGSS